MPSAPLCERAGGGRLSSDTMSETELSVICKNCGSEVSPYVTECPYCGARLRKRAPKLERRGDALEPKPRRRPAGRCIPAALRGGAALGAERPYATLAVILGSAALILVQKATAYGVASFGGLVVPVGDEWWRYLTAPFAYTDLGYLFVVAIALAIFGIGLERRLGSAATGLLMVACGSLGMLAATGDRQRPGRLRGDGRRQRPGARRRSPPGSRSAAPRRAGRSTRSTTGSASPWSPSSSSRCRSSSRPRTPTPGSSAALVGGLAGLLAAGVRPPNERRADSCAVCPDDERLEAAIERLTDSERFAEAERIVSRAAPQLQRVLATALAEGGWFGESHEARGAARPRRSPTPTSASPPSAPCSPRRRGWR